tara:strand:+ start:57 stop:977 length:921 start_codon:yes stop_codon:yes gene_type:complete
MPKKQIYIYTFYRFKNLKNIKQIKIQIEKKKENRNIFGTILIAKEGINGTISGTRNELHSYIKEIKTILKIRKISLKISKNYFMPFNRYKVRLKKEIVSIGKTNINPEKLTGKYIHPKNWDKIVNNKNYILIDARNDYEIGIGSFKNAINPETKSFRQFPNFIRYSKIDKNKPIAMFCTGGIRCEKASSFLLKNGYKNIYQLNGGILNYLEYKKNHKKSTWNGECFVFDNRVSLNKNLQKGLYYQCYGCRRPINKKDIESIYYKKGIHCPHCYNKRSKKQIKSSTSRQEQIDKAINQNIGNIFLDN